MKDTDRQSGRARTRRRGELTPWLGMDIPAWTRLLVANRFAIEPRYLPDALMISIAALYHSLMRGVQYPVFARRLARTTVRPDPLFIIGHWRCGTTLLHELLALDNRLVAPTTYECMCPSHFLLTGRMAQRLLKPWMRDVRPMDDFPAGLERPQEDEFALCSYGAPSPYRTIAFPNRPPQDKAYYELTDLTPRKLAAWKRVFLAFLRQLSCRTPGRLVLKAPPHTFRVPVLLDMFPEARFLHLVRDPYAVYHSTLHMRKSLYTALGLQTPTFEGLEEYVMATFIRMHEALDRARPLLAPNRFCELKYEALVADPVGQLESAYDQLELGAFEPVKPAIAARAAAIREHQPGRHEPSSWDPAELNRRWGPIIRRYGYAVRPDASPDPARRP